MFSPARRVAGTRAFDYLAAFRLAVARSDDTVERLLSRPETVYRRLWEPLATSALNTDPSEGAAKLLWPVLTQTFLRGEAWCRPYVADEGLSPCFVDPALAVLDAAGASVSFNRRVRGLEQKGGRLTGFDTTRRPVTVAATDAVVLALPAPAAKALLPDLAAPTDSRAIVNAHFRLDAAPTLPDGARFLGLVGGTAQWIFVRGNIASITVSAADALAGQSNDVIAETLWHDLASALDLDPTSMPPNRIINERRATFAQTTAAAANRPKTRTSVTNLFLAGDWTDTGLPATIEGAIQSGARAAALAGASQS
jgi:predicted NAD/FAD-dependent oxidoreductase